MLILFSGSCFAKTEFIQAPYNFNRWLADMQAGATLPITINVYQINVGTFVCTSSFTADTGNFLRNLWVRGEAVITELTVGTTVHGLVFLFDSSQGYFYADQLYWYPKGFADKTAPYYKTTQFSFYDGAGQQRNYIAPVIAIDSSCYFDFNNQGVGANDCFVFNTTRFGIGNDIANLRVFLSTGGYWNDWNGASHYFNDGLTLSCTIYAPTGRFYEIFVSTIFGTSPVYMPTGIKFSDDTVLTSTNGLGGFTSSSTARIPTVFVCASNAPLELKAIANYVCDGTHDFTEINSACDYINKLGGGEIILSNGNFSEVSVGGFEIYLSSHTCIRGQGIGATTLTLNASGGGGDVFNVRSGAKNIRIENITIYASGNGGNTIIGTDNSNIYIKNCELTGLTGSATFSTGIKFTVITNVWIQNNYILVANPDNKSNIRITSGKNIYIDNNSLYFSYSTPGSDKSAIGILESSGVFITNNYLDKSYYGVDIKSTNYNITVIGNNSNSPQTGFNILGSSCVVSGNSVYNASISNAIIAINGNKSDVNSWDSDNFKADGSVAMTGNLDMGGKSILNCPLIDNTTNAVAQLAIDTTTERTDRIAGDVAIGGTTNYLYSEIQSTRNACVATDTAISESTGVAVAQITSTYNYITTLVATDTYTLTIPIALSSWTETSDFGEYPTRSTFTIIDLVFVAKTSAPISAMTFSVKDYDTGNNIMNGSLSLSAGTRQSAVFTSTNTVPMDCGLVVAVDSGRCNAPVHAVFRIRKARGQ